MKFSNQRGSFLLITMCFVIIGGIAAASVMELSRSSYKISMRTKLQTEARAVAESEMEYLYFMFKSQVVSGRNARVVPTNLASDNVSDNSEIPSTTRVPFYAGYQAEGWRVKRSLCESEFLDNERIPGSTKEGSFGFLSARIEVIPPAGSPFGTNANVRIGRRFNNSSAPIFQYAIFFQGDLEFNPGNVPGRTNSTTISGEVVANGSIFMGPQSGTGSEIRLEGNVRYLDPVLFGHSFNSVAGVETFYTPVAPPPPATAVYIAPTFTGLGQTEQLKTMNEPENLLGGVDIENTAVVRADLFGPDTANGLSPALWTADEQIDAQNNIYRSLIIPPPDKSSYGTVGSEYPNVSSVAPPAGVDDPVIAVQRAYNRATLFLTVTNPTAFVWEKKYKNTVTGVVTIVDVTPDFAGVVTPWNVSGGAWITGTVYNSKAVWDFREGENVRVTEVDIGVLKTRIDALRAAVTDPANAAYLGFQGLFYINFMQGSAAAPSAVRLINAASLPYADTLASIAPPTKSNTNGQGGFSLATNGGIYIKGNYNITTPTGAGGVAIYPRRSPAGAPGVVPSMLMGDVITLLSDNWNDANAAGLIGTRMATCTVTPGTITVNAGLLTGNTRTTSFRYSGGAQNLVRYLEDWTGLNVNFVGSMARVFQPTKFTTIFGGVGSTYWAPARSWSFDHNILLYNPPGTPTSTSFSRGTFFTW